jgi:putative transposase
MGTQRYHVCDVTDAQWQVIEPLLPVPKKRPGGPGRPPSDRRQVVNGIFYVNRSGCQWRLMPRYYGNWNTVYDHFNEWSKAGVWEQVMTALRHQERRRQGRAAEPSAGSVDSQSVKVASQPGPKGIDGGKSIKGRKRHLLVDTLGLILVVVVTAANVNDRVGLRQLLKHYFADGFKRLRHVWVDGGYHGEPLQRWVAGLKVTYKIVLEVVENALPGFHLVKRRWVVERTFSWLLNCRRHSRDDEVPTRNSEAMIQVSMIHLLVRRLA